MAKLYNLARMTTATTGTGTITLGSAVTGWLSFAGSGVANGETVTYAIVEGNNREVGRGVYTSAGTTLTRSVLTSTNSNAPISLTGSAQVFITAAAEDFLGPAFGAYQSSAQSALGASTWTKISLQTEEFDTDNCFDSATNYRFTPNVAGYYKVTGALQMNGTTSVLIAGIYKNGSSYKEGPYFQSSFASPRTSVDCLVYLNGSTDYVEFYGLTGTSLSPSAGQPYTYFSAFLARTG